MKVKAPKEDPRIKSAREAEERRVDAAFIENTSMLLDEKGRKRVRRFGRRGLAAGVPGAGGGRGGNNGPGANGGSVDNGSYGGFTGRPSGSAGGFTTADTA